MNRDIYCVKLAKHLTELYGNKISSVDVSEQLMLIQLGQEPTDKVIGKWITNTATRSN